MESNSSVIYTYAHFRNNILCAGGAFEGKGGGLLLIAVGEGLERGRVGQYLCICKPNSYE